jgi:hypothetical protein
MTTDDVQALIRNSIEEREKKAAELRSIFTFAAEMKAGLMQDFDDGLPPFAPKLIYAEQDGRTIGKKPDSSQSLDGDRLVQMNDQFKRTANLLNKRARK